MKDAQAETAQRKLELAVETQRERAANAEKELLELKEGSSQRLPTLEQIAKLETALKGKPTAPLEIVYQAGNPEAKLFAMNVRIELARMQVKLLPVWETANADAGIQVLASDLDDPLFKSFWEALRTAGFNPTQKKRLKRINRSNTHGIWSASSAVERFQTK